MKRLFLTWILLIVYVTSGCSGPTIAPTTEEVVINEPSPVEVSNRKDNEIALDEKEEDQSNMALTTEEKLEDFEYLFNVLSLNYPYFEMDKRIYSIDWLANADIYREKIKGTENDLKFYLALNKIVDDIKHSHARLLKDGMYASMLATYKAGQLEPWLDVLEDPVVQSRYSYQGNEADTDFEMTTEDYIIPDNITLEKWTDTSTAYIGIKSFSHFNIEGDWKLLQPFIYDLDDIDSLIIDIRGNTGEIVDIGQLTLFRS